MKSQGKATDMMFHVMKEQLMVASKKYFNLALWHDLEHKISARPNLWQLINNHLNEYVWD